MSVINQMLRELDRRRPPPPVTSAGDTSAVRLAAPRSARRLPLLVLAGAAAIGAVAYGDWPVVIAGRANAATAITSTRAPLATVEPAPADLPLTSPSPLSSPLPLPQAPAQTLVTARLQAADAAPTSAPRMRPPPRPPAKR